MRPAPRLAAASLLLASLAPLALVACASPDPGGATPPAPTAAVDPLLADLQRFEAERRAATDFERAPPSDHRFGADPYVIRAAGPDRFVGLLRGAGALVLLDRELDELARADAPRSPSGLAVSGDAAFVVGEGSPEIHVYTWAQGALTARPSIPLPEARALRDVAAGPEGALYAVDEADGRLFTLLPRPASAAPAPPDAARPYDVTATAACAGAFRVARTPHHLVVDCLLDHTLLAFRVDPRGAPQPDPARIRNDGPLWCFAAIEDRGALLVASGGVEDKPLDRTHGSFENIDSFVYLHEVRWDAAPAPATVTRLASVNVSDHGVLVPKALLVARSEHLEITVTGYGGEAFATLVFRVPSLPPAIIARPLPPGTSSLAADASGNLVLANPLLDAWILYRTEHLPGVTVPVASTAPARPRDTTRTAASRIGEALIFTSLIAPWNRSEGPLSRFTCETCHFEGFVDGRTHATGRGEVRATTKPLLGLFGNGPHFSRALDPDLATVAMNEFRVANARSEHDPVFDATLAEHPWLADLGATDADLTAPALRRAFMTFLMEWSHRPSALTAGRASFTPAERRGAEVFRDRCEGCHEARASTDPASPRVPFDRWEPLVLSEPAPLVWAQPRYAKTGVTPYVHSDGARVPSLRRLYKKHPYFTNGSARSLGDVLSRARFTPDGFFHDAPPEGAPATSLSEGERAALEAFLRLL